MKSKSILNIDILLILATIILMIIGILFIYSSGVTSTGVVFSNEYIKQIVWVITGIIIMFTIAFFDYQYFFDWSPIIYGLIVLLLVLTLFFGAIVNGARSWLQIGGIGIQPSEFMKIAVIIFLARYLSTSAQEIHKIQQFLIAFAIIMVPVLLILLQPDMGTALVYLPIFFFMTFVSGAKVRHILFIFFTGLLTIVLAMVPSWVQFIHGETINWLAFLTERSLTIIVALSFLLMTSIAGIGFLVFKRIYFYWITYVLSIVTLSFFFAIGAQMVLQDYQIMRLIVFLDPEVDPRGAGWHIIQSVTAVGSGGFLGKGFLQGTQSHYRFLPQQSTDFIFSVIAEEWGFIGGILVFTLFLIILVRGLVIAGTAQDKFSGYIAAGLVGMFFFHFVINIGMAMGIMPITGIPLLFISYGGSSLWTALVGVGILVNIAMKKNRI
ncbi:MAG: rod shape-determining protein RodA [Spirochaetia bacterium]